MDDLGTYALPWSDLLAIIRWAPPDSPIARALNGDMSAWATTIKTNAILADLADILSGANWQRGGGRRAKPKPYPRPGDKSKQKFGKRKMTRHEAVAWLARRRQGLAA